MAKVISSILLCNFNLIIKKWKGPEKNNIFFLSLASKDHPRIYVQFKYIIFLPDLCILGNANCNIKHNIVKESLKILFLSNNILYIYII